MTPGTSTVVFCMEGHGHIKRLLPLISGLARAGLRNHVFTQPQFEAQIENAGGVFVDLFRGRPRDDADASSIPISCRNVSFAGHYAEQIVDEAAALKSIPGLERHLRGHRTRGCQVPGRSPRERLRRS